MRDKSGGFVKGDSGKAGGRPIAAHEGDSGKAGGRLIAAHDGACTKFTV
jgi:hypothetical protein